MLKRELEMKLYIAKENLSHALKRKQEEEENLLLLEAASSSIISEPRKQERLKDSASWIEFFSGKIPEHEQEIRLWEKTLADYDAASSEVA